MHAQTALIQRLCTATPETPGPLGPVLQQSSPLRPAAVLIPLVFQASRQAWEILLTVKQTHLTHHGGQVCCPGGQFDPKLDTDLAQTALRECEEETGIESRQIELLGEIGHLDTSTGFRVHGFIGLIEQPLAPLRLDPGELSDYFWVPIEVALAPDQYTKRSVELNQTQLDTYHFNYAGYCIWGATARLLYEVALLSASPP